MNSEVNKAKRKFGTRQNVQKCLKKSLLLLVKRKVWKREFGSTWKFDVENQLRNRCIIESPANWGA